MKRGAREVVIIIDGENLTIDDVIKVARYRRRVSLSEFAKSKIEISRKNIDKIRKSGKKVYGISTGFGALRNVLIPPEDRETLQRNLILSHATGVGEFLSEEIIRAALLLRINSFAKGYSGVRLLLVEKLIEMLNRDIYPAVPAKGSVGASGDLVPLSHIALVLIGEGKVFENNRIIDSSICLKQKEIMPITLTDKEGLALINGTQIMSAIATLVCYDATRLFKVADIAGALSIEALKGALEPFDLRYMHVRPYNGQIAVAHNILMLTENSSISKIKSVDMQDAYSIRCIPQVHGASRDLLEQVKTMLQIEINSVTDNPIILPDSGEVLCGGNFHGQPMALSMDALKVAIAEMGSISERRLSRMLDAHYSKLPEFLTLHPGVNSGLMITQYTAAALVSENKVLAHPASVDSIPTSANQEDHVSMGTIAARQTQDILNNVQYVIAIEILASVQGIDFLSSHELGKGTKTAHEYIRKYIPHMDEDRILTTEIGMIREMICDNSLLEVVESSIGSLK